MTDIRIYNFFIRPKDLQALKMDIWSDDPVQAVLNFEQKKYDIDIVYRGAHTRNFIKKSYYFECYKPKLFQGAKALHLNAEYKDPSFIRNKLSLDFFNDLGVLSPQSEHVLVKINGRTEGVYLQLESVDEYFLKNRDYPGGPIFYAIDGDANFSLMSDLDKQAKDSLFQGYEQIYGKDEERGYLENAIYKINTLGEHEFEHEVERYINVTNYLRWLAGVICTQNYDGFVHNYALYRNSESGQFEMIPWDYDGTWGRDVNGEEMDYDYVRIEGFNTLTARLLATEKYKKEYIHILKNTLNNQFTVDYMKPKIEKLYHTLRPYVLKDRYKKENIQQFDEEPEYILDFIKKRSYYIEKNLLGTL